MEAKLGINGYRGFQNIFTKTVTQSESQDSVVPDTMPDVSAILCTSGCALIRSKDVAEGRVRLEANIPARVCCAGAEDGSVFCLDVNVPFYISAEDKAIRDGCVCTADLTLKHLEARMLNPRKVSVRAEVEAGLACFAEGEELFASAPAEDGGAVHVLERVSEISVIASVTEKTFVLTDEFELAQERAELTQIVAQNAAVAVQEFRTVGSKVILSGDVRSELTFLTADDGLETAVFHTAFSQIAETGTETDDALCEANTLISGMYYELTQGNGVGYISMELHLVAFVTVYARRALHYLSDAYSNAWALSLRRRQTELARYGREVVLRDSSVVQIEVPGEVGSVIACHAEPYACRAEPGQIRAQLLLRLCWRCGDAVFSAERSMDRAIGTDAPDEALKLCSISVTDVSAVPGGAGMEVRVTLEARAFTLQRTAVDAICAIEYDETQPRCLDDVPTLVMLRPRADAALWALARENCSTAEAICAANGLTDDELPADRLLLIPKTV